MKSWIGRLLLAIWFVGMVVVAGRGMPAQGQAESGGEPKQYFPTMLRNAPVLAEPPLNGYLGLAVVGTDEATELYTFRADGSEVRRLTENTGAELDPQWSPNGNQIAFLQPQSDAPGHLQVMVMNRDGSGLQAVGSPKVGANGEVKWSPNGRYLLVVIGNGKPLLIEGELTLLAVDGSNEVTIEGQVLNNPNGEWAWGWSPNSGYAYFIHNDGFWTYTIADNTTTRVSDIQRYSYPSIPEHPQILWRSDSQEIALKRSFSEGVVVTPDGSQSRVLFNEPYAFGGWLDGERQILLMAPSQQPSGGNVFYTMSFGGGMIVPFAVDDEYGFILGGISPVGDKVLYQAGWSSGKMIIHPLGGEPRDLNGARCSGAYGSPCFLGGEVDWADNGMAVLYGMYTWDTTGRRNAHTVVYSPVGVTTAPSVRISSLQSPTFLPVSSTYGIAYLKTSQGYPEPTYSYVQRLQLPGGATTPLFTDLGNYVDVVEWRYLP